MSKTMTIIKREFFTRVKTKGFIIGTILFPIFMIAMTVLPGLLMNLKSESAKNIAIIDQTGKIYAPLVESFADKKLKNGDQMYKFEEVVYSDDRIDEITQKLNTRVESGQLAVYLFIKNDIFEANKFDMYMKNTSDFDFIRDMEGKVYNIVSRMRLAESGLDADMVKKLNAWVKATTLSVSKGEAKEEIGALKFVLAYIMVFLLYMSLAIYGSFTMRGVVEDKNSRVVEVIISSVKPEQYMAGKILGIGSTGLVQILVWMIAGVLLSTYGLMIAQAFAPNISSIPFPTINPWMGVGFIVFFVLGFFLFSTLYATIGSMVNSESEAQNLQWFATLPLIMSFVLMFSIIKTPDSTLAITLSHIPLFSPILMVMRMGMNAVPLWEVLVSMATTTLTIAILVWFTAKIFRIGILMYGKRVTLPEAIKWIR